MFIADLMIYLLIFFFFFFGNNNCIKKQINLQHLQGGKKTVGGALLPLQVEGEKKIGMQPE